MTPQPAPSRPALPRQAPPPVLVSAAAVLGGLLGGAVLFGGAVLRSWHGPLPAPPALSARSAPPALSARSAPPANSADVGLFRVPDRFGRGDSLSDVLTRNGVSRREVNAVSEALRPVADVRRLKTGQTIWLDRDESGAPIRIELALDDFREVAVTRSGGGWKAREFVAEPVSRRAGRNGTVESSLYESLVGLGERGDLAVLIARALEYDIDFHRDTRRGDSFSFVVDKLYSEDGVWKGYGELHAVHYLNAGRPLYAFRFELPTGEEGYYDYDGNSIQRQFLMSPVAYTRISGVFTSRRLHPVHRVYRPHYGVDYAAPHGTPVMATANGVVADAGMRGPNGNMVTLRHTGGYVTKYLHLSRIPSGIRPGRRVSQRDVIGYVGSTGVSTGPHLDYRLSRRGTPLDPRSHILPPGPPIPDEHRDLFEGWRDGLVRLFGESDGVSPARRAGSRSVVAGTEGP